MVTNKNNLEDDDIDKVPDQKNFPRPLRQIFIFILFKNQISNNRNTGKMNQYFKV